MTTLLEDAKCLSNDQYGAAGMHFSTNDMQRKTGVKRHRLHNWILTKTFLPSEASRVAGGHGIDSEYSQTDLYRIALLRKLIENGFHATTAALVVNGTDFKNLHGLHDLHIQEKKAENPGLILCLGRRFKNGEEANMDVWVETPGYRHLHGKGAQLQEKVIKLFNQRQYDDVYLINLSKLIEEVDGR